jgi:pimeloyl-ACP methyl ester carboxylesterase
MSTVTSADGTTIAYDRIGDGPPVVIVDGALCHRAFGPSAELAKALSDHFTVYTYDRRGRGDSTDIAPYAVRREIEDIEAVIGAAAGPVRLYGASSGAVLALEAADRLTTIEKIAVYEPPLFVDDSRPPAGDATARIDAQVAAGQRSKAVGTFMRLVGVPAPGVAFMHLMPAWGKLKAVAHTLPYDQAIVAEHQQGKPLPAGLWDSITAPALVMDGGKSPTWMRHSTQAVAKAVPGADYRTLEGQTHMLKTQAVAPVLTAFFSAGNG